MGTRLLLLYVICQAVFTESLGGVTIPFTDVIGKVTPIKPKPLPASAVSSTDTLSSLTCDSKDTMPQLFSPAPGIREFSSPLALTSTSRALPVPKIDSLSIADVKLPERLRDKFLSSKLCNAPIKNAKTDIDTPDVSLPYKYPFLSCPTRLPNALPSYTSLKKISSVPILNSLPVVPLEPLNTISADLFCLPSKNNNILASPAITTLPRSRTLGVPLTFEARNPSFSEQYTTNTLSLLEASCSSPYRLHYKSMYLPGVRTPSEILPLSFRPISYKVTANTDFPSQSGSCNVISPINLTSDSSLNSLPSKNAPYLSTYLNPIKTAEIPKPINTMQLPKIPSNVPVSIKPVFSAQNVAAKNIKPPLEGNSGSASVAFESTFEPPEFLSSPVLKDCTDSKMLRSSMPYLVADKIPDFRLKPCTPLKIRPSTVGSTSNFLNSPVTPLVPISPSSPIVDLLSNRLSSFDCSKYINTPDVFPTIGACVETIEKINTNGPGSNCQTRVDSKYVPSLERINLSSPFAPKLASYQHPLFTEERVTNPLKYLPLEPVPTISSGSSAVSPLTYFPPKILQTPSSVCSINQSPSSFAQSTLKMVSSINDVVSNIVQNILSSYKSYIDSPPNVSQRPTCTIQPNHYDTTEFIPKQILPVIPLSQGNEMMTEPILPIISLPICIDPSAIETSTILSSDVSCKSSAFEISSNQPLLIASQPTATVLPPTSLITYPSPQLCPSYLPSPTLPAYPTIASPFYKMEAPVFKVSTSKKDTDVEKIIELMLLAEILNNDESFDWDDLDTLLAFLSVS